MKNKLLLLCALLVTVALASADPLSPPSRRYDGDRATVDYYFMRLEQMRRREKAEQEVQTQPAVAAPAAGIDYAKAFDLAVDDLERLRAMATEAVTRLERDANALREASKRDDTKALQAALAAIEDTTAKLKKHAQPAK